jgi:hypothetical protein
MLHVALALNRSGDLVVELEPNEPGQRASLGESPCIDLAMLIGATSDVRSDAGVERTVRPVRVMI